jgi:hypothetical protein
MFVSCLPVVALALGTALAHLLREPGEEIPSAEEAAETVAAAVPIPPVSVPETVADAVPEVVPANVPEIEPEAEHARTVPPVPVTVPKTLAARARKRVPASRSKTPERIFAAEIDRGELPSLREVKRRAACGTDRARVIRDQLAATLQEVPEAA